jgi:hypothetical protein
MPDEPALVAIISSSLVDDPRPPRRPVSGMKVLAATKPCLTRNADLIIVDQTKR